MTDTEAVRELLREREVEWALDFSFAMRLDMQRAVSEGRALQSWLDLLVFAARPSPSNVSRPICEEILAVNALLSYVERLRWKVPDGFE